MRNTLCYTLTETTAWLGSSGFCFFSPPTYVIKTRALQAHVCESPPPHSNTHMHAHTLFFPMISLCQAAAWKRRRDVPGMFSSSGRVLFSQKRHVCVWLQQKGNWNDKIGIFSITWSVECMCVCVCACVWLHPSNPTDTHSAIVITSPPPQWLSIPYCSTL